MPRARTRDHASATLIASLAASLAGLTGLGCAAGQATPATQHALELSVESTTPRAEGAAFFSVASDSFEDIAARVRKTTSRCPAEMALIAGRVCVDRWEASLVERVSGQGERPWSPYLSIDGHESFVRAVSRPGTIPQGYISGKQAQAACNASGKRLCGANEWELACRGPEVTQFPYGAERRRGACNDDIRAVHPVVEASSLLSLQPGSLWREAMNVALINQLPHTLLKTAERDECTNDYGVFDMVGNLHEWIDDPAGTFRGGYYMDTTRNGEGCAYATTAHDFDYHDYSTGFRCCMDPDRVE